MTFLYFCELYAIYSECDCGKRKECYQGWNMGLPHYVKLEGILKKVWARQKLKLTSEFLIENTQQVTRKGSSYATKFDSTVFKLSGKTYIVLNYVFKV